MIALAWIVVALGFALILYLDLITDFKRIQQGIGVQHTRGGIFRVLGFAANALVFCFLLPEISTWIIIGWFFKIILLQCFAFWLLFDAILNKLRKRPLLYIGKTAALDKFFGKYGTYVMLAAKLIGLTLVVLWLIL